MLPVVLTAAKKALIIGGGKAAAYKVKSLRAAGIDVVCVSVAFSDAVASADIERVEGDFYETESYLYEMFDLVYLAIPYPDDDPEKRVFFDEMRAWLKQKRIPVLVCAKPEMGDFIHPATRANAEMMVSVSTRGENPRRAVELAERALALLEESEKTR